MMMMSLFCLCLLCEEVATAIRGRQRLLLLMMMEVMMMNKCQSLPRRKLDVPKDPRTRRRVQRRRRTPLKQRKIQNSVRLKMFLCAALTRVSVKIPSRVLIRKEMFFGMQCLRSTKSFLMKRMWRRNTHEAVQGSQLRIDSCDTSSPKFPNSTRTTSVPRLHCNLEKQKRITDEMPMNAILRQRGMTSSSCNALTSSGRYPSMTPKRNKAKLTKLMKKMEKSTVTDYQKQNVKTITELGRCKAGIWSDQLETRQPNDWPELKTIRKSWTR